MVPSKDDTIESLKSIISDLQGRVAQLERRLNPQQVQEGIRMILLGPPGAGMISQFLASHHVLYTLTGAYTYSFFLR